MSNHSNQDDEAQGGDQSGDFFDAQRDLISLIDDYRLTHLVDNKKMSLKAFAEHAQISVPIITAITNGNRFIANCTRETIEKLAAALEIPVLQIYILCGYIKNEDVVYTANIDSTLEVIYRMMSRDKVMTFKLPQKAIWDTWPKSAKIAFAMMYEDLTSKVLLRYINLPEK